MDFYDLDLSDQVLDALDDMNFTECTPIQEHAIPVILEGRDMIGVAQTGTGKTAAFLLPILSKLSDGGYPEKAINCIIMSPTRELAQQTAGEIRKLEGDTGIRTLTASGGREFEEEKRKIGAGGCHCTVYDMR